MLSQADIKQLKTIGFSEQQILNQLAQFKTGFPFVQLIRPAVINDGIKYVTTRGDIKLNQDFDEFSQHIKIIKFVPASGAATRMFKDLFDFKEEYNNPNIDQKTLDFGTAFFASIEKFAFYDDLKLAMKKDRLSIEKELESKNYKIILDYLLTSKGLNYANLPKALIKFHNYGDESHTAIEEHLIEGALYGKSGDGKVYIHFTLSPEHVSLFEKHIAEVIAKYEIQYDVKYDISHSIQQPTSDTLAVNLDNTPFRTSDSKLLFRPAGHGALIWNVNQLDGDIVFIKNIDNVVPERKVETTVVSKKIIGSLLIQYKKNIDKWLKQLKSKAKIKIEDLVVFINNELGYELPISFEQMDDQAKRDFLITFLNRPLRVCGMVENVGEPGGGPFWVSSKDGISLQIIESSQIDLKNEEQRKIFEQSSHFNPVDIVCSVKDYEGKMFDLTQYVDSNTGFISQKSKDGKDLKALELPGLWNGAMANWITIFVEVPIATFNPVKTINDLLRNEHQS